MDNINAAKNALSSGAGGDGNERDGGEHLLRSRSQCLYQQTPILLAI